MEDGVHLPRGWESEFIGGRGEDLFNFKWTFLFRGKFARRVVEIKVLVVKPDFIFNFPGGDAGVYEVLH